jgi:hypothetical protein
MTLDSAREHLYDRKEKSISAQQLTVVIIEHVQRPKPAAICQYVADKVE